MQLKKNAKAEWGEKVYDYVIACSSLKGFRTWEVVQDFESRSRKAVTFVVERRKERQKWREQRMLKVLPGYSGGRLQGQEDEGSEERRVRHEIIKKSD